MTFALCCDNSESGGGIKRRLEELGDVTAVLFCNVSEFILAVSDNPDAVMMIAQKGSQSTETAMMAREHNPQGKLVWFCDLDFALLSFRLKATYFGLLPVDDENLRTALDRCEAVL